MSQKDIRSYFENPTRQKGGKESNETKEKEKELTQFSDSLYELFEEKHENPGGVFHASTNNSSVYSFSLPSIFGSKQSNTTKNNLNQSTEGVEQIDDIEEYEEEKEEKEINITSTTIHIEEVKEKKKITKEAIGSYREWQKRQNFRKNLENLDLTTLPLTQQIEKQQSIVNDWQTRLNYALSQVEKVKESLAVEEKKLTTLRDLASKVQENSNVLSLINATEKSDLVDQSLPKLISEVHIEPQSNTFDIESKSSDNIPKINDDNVIMNGYKHSVIVINDFDDDDQIKEATNNVDNNSQYDNHTESNPIPNVKQCNNYMHESDDDDFVNRHIHSNSDNSPKKKRVVNRKSKTTPKVSEGKSDENNESKKTRKKRGNNDDKIASKKRKLSKSESASTIVNK